jgi:hypothetical protein
MFGRSFVGRKFTPLEGLDATADRNRSGKISYTCVSLWQRCMPEGRMSLGEWISDDEDDSGGCVCAGEQGAVC